MSDLLVIGNQLFVNGRSFRCAIGKGGFSRDKREGDGCTPLGIFAFRECWYRPDHVAVPETQLPLREIHQKDGWCDDSKSHDYNKHVKLPYSFSHERLWRDDRMYDLVIPMGYNDDPVVPGRGSAIFMHVAQEGFSPTEGCVALALGDLLALLPDLSAKSQIEIREK